MSRRLSSRTGDGREVPDQAHQRDAVGRRERRQLAHARVTQPALDPGQGAGVGSDQGGNVREVELPGDPQSSKGGADSVRLAGLRHGWRFTKLRTWAQARSQQRPETVGTARLGAMAKKNRPVSRYSLAKACLNVETAMGRSRPPVLNKELAAEMGLNEGTFSHKLRNTAKSSFTIEELGLIADWFNAPAGWPFVDADVRKAR